MPVPDSPAEGRYFLGGPGLTPLPRWTTAPADREVGLDIAVPDQLTASGHAVDPLLATAIAAVVGLLAAESDVTIGHQAGPADPIVPLTIRLPDGSWRDLITAVRTVLQTARSPEIGISEIGNSIVVWCTGPQISLRSRASDFDSAYLARLGVYLTTTLTAAAGSHAVAAAAHPGTNDNVGPTMLIGQQRRPDDAVQLAGSGQRRDPDAPWADTDLLSPAERRHLLAERSGPERPLPDEPAHVLIARRARDRPDDMAVRYRAERWTYNQVNRSANRIAHALLEAGLRREDVVAVGTDRTPRWLCAILGVLKAGGCYLPIEPDYPAARTAELAQRANVTFALTEPSGLAGLAAMTGLWSRPVAELIDAGYPDTDPAIAVTPDQLAYVYFTSGSTGVPKGAMCEHLGMINHLMAKVDDFGIGPGDIVVQNARQSFDISLWQLLAPLLVGGATLIVPADDILDVRRLVDAVVAEAATVLQVVPSYLDVLLRYLEQHPRDLGRLRAVCVTGEAITMPLVTRWFGRCPGITLVNAFGATEASDDTTHEIMQAPPPGELVPVGRPIGNVTVYVLGPGDSLQPLGTPGEIAFSGICVGRGYINDAERTAEVFAADPFRPGCRIYRTGDYGRWLPTGSLEFQGRRDEQVKIQGVRIELGEVEARAVSHPRVLAAAVVVVPMPDGTKSLAIFYTSGDGLDAADLRAHLAGSLAPSATPARIERIESLPLTENGKVDKRQLTNRALAAQAAAGSRDRAAPQIAPRTATQRRIARAWAQAMNRPITDIGSDDNFFDLGGSSLAALRVVASLNGLIALDDLVRNPVLGALAAVADGDHGEPGGMLRLLAGPATEPTTALVCVPYAAGTAISFQALAGAMAARDSGVAVYAVQPPGHDLGRPDVPLAELDQLTKLLASEITAIAAPVALWGHCAGAAAALETARRLPESVIHVFVAARLLDSATALAREVAVMNAVSDADLGDELAADGGLDGLPELSRADLAFVGRVYRHDTRTANQYLAMLARGGDPPEPPAVLPAAPLRLRCPLTVVASATDPLTAGYRERFADWGAFADSVTLSELDDGGHYFPRTRPDRAADIIVRALRTAS